MGSRTIGATFWSAIEVGARYGVQIVVTIVLARMLSPTDFGLLAMLLVFTNIGMVFVDSGFSAALIQKQETSLEDETTAFLVNLFVAALGVILLWVGADVVADFFHEPRLVALVQASSWILLLGAIGGVPDALLTQKMAFRARTKAQVISSVASGGVAIMAAMAGYGVWSLVLQVLISTGLRSACVWFLSGWRPRGGISVRSFRGLFRFGGFMFLSALLNATGVRLQSLLLGRLFDAGTLGYYSLAQSATRAPTSFIGTFLSRLGLPVFSRFSSDKQKLREALRQALELSMFVFVPIMVGLALAARPLIIGVYGPQWEAAAPIASLLALSGLLWPLHVLNLSALGAQGHSGRLFSLEILKSVVLVSATLFLARSGPIAVAAGVFASGLINVGINIWYSQKLLDYGFLAQLRDQGPTLVLAGLAAVPAWACLHWGRGDFASLLLAMLAASTVYLGLAAGMQLRAWVLFRSSIVQMMRPIRSVDSAHG
jgi:O-antigen/teichoic acid export membrane protein